MWSDRKPNESSPSPSSAPSMAASQSATAATPAVSQDRPPAVDGRGIAVIGKGMVIKGQIRSGEHMHISGDVEGSLYLAGYDLTVTAQSRVKADVTAREVDIAGSIQGNVDATRKITVRKGGRLIGDLRTPGIVIEDGAYFKGNIEIVTRENQNGSSADTSAAAQPAAAVASA